MYTNTCIWIRISVYIYMYIYIYTYIYTRIHGGSPGDPWEIPGGSLVDP